LAEEGQSTGFPESEWISTLKHTMQIDEYITNNVKILDRAIRRTRRVLRRRVGHLV
jgi:hypothetical protein